MCHQNLSHSQTKLSKVAIWEAVLWRILLFFDYCHFMIAEQIPETDCLWSLFLLLREIVDMVIAPVTRRSCIPYLSEKIIDFLSTFHQHFVGKITPKMHYMIHYPRLILSYGPLVHLSRLRFEAKHQYFKTVATVLGNFKNISKTFARWHQFRQCWEQSDTYCLGINTETADTQNIPVEALPIDACKALNRIFQNIDAKKSPGPDKVGGKVLKTCAEQLCGIFHHIFLEFFKLQKVPNIWKTSNIVPVQKNSVPKDLNDFRSVALLTLIMKGFEKIVRELIFQQIETSLDPLQFAYREGGVWRTLFSVS